MAKQGKENIILLQKKERLARIHEIKAMLEKSFKAGREVDKEKLIATCCLDYGLSRRTVLEYLKVLAAYMGLLIEKEVISSIGKKG